MSSGLRDFHPVCAIACIPSGVIWCDDDNDPPPPPHPCEKKLFFSSIRNTNTAFMIPIFCLPSEISFIKLLALLLKMTFPAVHCIFTTAYVIRT